MNLLYRPPYVGLLAFFIVFVVQGLGHTVMIVMEDVWPGHEYVLQSAFAMGLLGAVLLNLGMRSKNEVSATWLGFWAGTFLWTGWVEFAFVWSGDFLNYLTMSRMDRLFGVTMAEQGVSQLVSVDLRRAAEMVEG